MQPYKLDEAIEYNNTRSSWGEVVSFFLEYIRSDNFLDAGCGTGNDLTSIYNQTGFIGYGSDKSKDMLKVTKNRGCLSTLKQADLDREFPFEKIFDVIYSHDVIHHLKHPNLFINNSFRHLSRNGVLIIGSEFQEGLKEKFSSLYFNNAYQLDMNRYHSLADVTAWIKNAGFNKIKIKRINDFEILNDQIMSQIKTRSHSILRLLKVRDFKEGLKKIIMDYESGKLTKIKRDYTLLAAQKNN